MNEILLKALESLLQIIVGGKVYETVIEMVKTLMDEDLENDAKRKLVKQAVYPLLSELGKLVINSLIGLVVSIIRLEMEKQNEKTN